MNLDSRCLDLGGRFDIDGLSGKSAAANHNTVHGFGVHGFGVARVYCGAGFEGSSIQ